MNAGVFEVAESSVASKVAIPDVVDGRDASEADENPAEPAVAGSLYTGNVAALDRS